LEIRVQGSPVRVRHGTTNVITTTATGADLVGAFNITGSVVATGTITASNLSGVNTGDQDLSSYATTAALTAGLAGKEPTIAAGTTAQYWRGDKSWQTLNKAAVGLSNVDNTSDVNKPVSTAQQTALDLKANSADIPILASGTYTPTLTNVANVTTNSALSCQYMRVGDTVTVSGRVDVTATANATLTKILLSLPVASNFTNSSHLGGTAASNGTTMIGYFSADTGSDEALLSFTSNSTANRSFWFNFTYRIA
jgi:hypothetical protein